MRRYASMQTLHSRRAKYSETRNMRNTRMRENVRAGRNGRKAGKIRVHMQK